MAVAVDNSAIYGLTSAVTSDSRSFTVGASATLLLVLMESRQTRVFSGITYNGVALTQAGTPNTGGGTSTLDAWYLVSPPTGTHTLVVSWSLGTDVIICPVSFNGTSTSAPFRPQTGGANFLDDSANPGTAPSAVVASAVGDLCVDWLAYGDTTIVTPTLGAGQTVLQDSGRFNSITHGYSSTEPGAAGTTTMSETITSRQYNHRSFAIQAPAAGGSSVPTRTLLGVGT